MKRVVVISDLHCGHIVGLTPAGWDADVPHAQLQKAYKMRRAIWNWYAATLKKLQPIDILIVNGDCIDGRNEGQGGTELLHVDRTDQGKMAAHCILEARAKIIVMSYGTGYHTGVGDEFERPIADKVGAKKLGSVDNISVNGVVVNYRHYVGASQVPHTRYTALGREMLWNTLWAERGEYPKANIIIRSHVHYFAYVGGPDHLVVSTPGLEGYGGKYGARLLSGIVDIGMIYFDIEKSGKWDWGWELKKLPKTEAIEL